MNSDMQLKVNNHQLILLSRLMSITFSVTHIQRTTPKSTVDHDVIILTRYLSPVNRNPSDLVLVLEAST